MPNKTDLMICDLCGTTLHPLNAHMGRNKNGNLTTAHIDCWNEYYAEEIKEEKIKGYHKKCLHGPNMPCIHNKQGNCQTKPQPVQAMCTVVCMGVVSRNNVD